MAQVQEAGCAALWSLAEADQQNPLLATTACAVEAVVAAMSAHPLNVPVQAVGCAALKCFAEMGNGNAVASAGGVEATVAALRLHGAVAAIQETGLDTLAITVQTHPAVVKLARDAGTVEVAEAAITTRFPQHEGVQRAGHAVLALFPKGSLFTD